MAADVRGTWGRYAPRFAAEGTAAETRDSLVGLVELCDLPAGSRVLDVGTGAGYTAFVFSRAGCLPVGCDPTHEMLLAYQAGWADRELPGAPRVAEAWAEDLPFGQASFDAVVAHRAPHQFRDLGAFLREAKRVVRSGGVVGISDQSPSDGWEEWHNQLERLRDPTHERARSPGEWRALLAEAGLQIRAEARAFQPFDVEVWLDTVQVPEERRAEIRRMYETIPEAIRSLYDPRVESGRLRMRIPHYLCVAAS